MNQVALFKYSATDAPMLWTIRAEGSRLIIEYGQLGGAMMTSTEDVEINQSGRDIESQVALRLMSRVNKQVDKGYCYTLEEAEASKGLNAAKLLRPMLAKKFKDVKNIGTDLWAQHKYNGHRCLITCTDGQNIAYSRNGKPITSIGHILDNIVLDEGDTVDGELYHHGTSLQTIGSWIRRDQPESAKLSYIMYDKIERNSYNVRMESLRSLTVKSDKLTFAPTFRLTNVQDMLNESISQGYEGLMLRQNNFVYEPGIRSSGLIKLKKFMDQEFLVIGIHPSKDGWAILECLIGESDTFRVSAPGTIDEKTIVLNNKNNYLGRYINVEFFEWTDDGKPFHPVATYWRT